MPRGGGRAKQSSSLAERPGFFRPASGHKSKLVHFGGVFTSAGEPSFAPGSSCASGRCSCVEEFRSAWGSRCLAYPRCAYEMSSPSGSPAWAGMCSALPAGRDSAALPRHGPVDSREIAGGDFWVLVGRSSSQRCAGGRGRRGHLFRPSGPPRSEWTTSLPGPDTSSRIMCN